MSDDQDGCEWVSVSSGTGLPGLSRTKAVKQLCVCVLEIMETLHGIRFGQLLQVWHSGLSFLRHGVGHIVVPCKNG